MPDKPVALVTGANKGIGLQIAKDLATHGFTALVGSRNLQDGEDAAKIVGDDARAVQLDVTDQSSIAAAAARTERRLVSTASSPAMAAAHSMTSAGRNRFPPAVRLY